MLLYVSYHLLFQVRIDYEHSSYITLQAYTYQPSALPHLHRSDEFHPLHFSFHRYSKYPQDQ